jgi:hypothetical protein
MVHTPNLAAALPKVGNTPQVSCPDGYGYGAALNNGNCGFISLPKIDNNLIWQNRAFHIEVGGFGTGAQNLQHIVTLVPQLTQNSTGECMPGVYYWDIGVRGDTDPLGGNRALPGGTTGVDAKLSPRYSLLTSTTSYTGENFTTTGQAVNKQYCNGARIPPENCGPDVTSSLNPGLCRGFNAPAGRSETTGLSPVFTLTNITPAATVDEGKNWINLTYGPLTLNHPVTLATLGDYTPVAGSPAIDAIPFGGPTYAEAPAADFFGNQRKVGGSPVTIGAVELAVAARSFTVAPSPLDFGTVLAGTTTPSRTITLTNGPVAMELAAPAFVVSGTNATQFAVIPGGTCVNNLALAPNATCTVNLRFTAPAATGSRSATLTVFSNAPTKTVTLTGNSARGTATFASATAPATLTTTGGGTGGTLAFGDLSGAQFSVVTVAVAGQVSVTFTAATVANATGQSAFTKATGADTCSGATIQPGSTCTIRVDFNAPPTTVNSTGTLRVPSNATTSPISLSLTGS